MSAGNVFICQACLARAQLQRAQIVRPWQRQSRAFSAAPARRKHGAVPSFRPTASPTLNDLFSKLRNNVFMPSQLLLEQQAIVYRTRNHHLITGDEAATVKLGDEVHTLRPLNRLHDEPRTNAALSQAYKEMKELRDFSNLQPLLTGMARAKRVVKSPKLIEAVRKASQVGQHQYVLQCLQHVQDTKLGLWNLFVAREVLWGAVVRAEQGSFSDESKHAAAQYADNVWELLQSKLHQPVPTNKLISRAQSPSIGTPQTNAETDIIAPADASEDLALELDSAVSADGEEAGAVEQKVPTAVEEATEQAETSKPLPLYPAEGVPVPASPATVSKNQNQSQALLLDARHRPEILATMMLVNACRRDTAATERYAREFLRCWKPAELEQLLDAPIDNDKHWQLLVNGNLTAWSPVEAGLEVASALLRDAPSTTSSAASSTKEDTPLGLQTTHELADGLDIVRSEHVAPAMDTLLSVLKQRDEHWAKRRCVADRDVARRCAESSGLLPA